MLSSMKKTTGHKQNITQPRNKQAEDKEESGGGSSKSETKQNINNPSEHKKQISNNRKSSSVVATSKGSPVPPASLIESKAGFLSTPDIESLSIASSNSSSEVSVKSVKMEGPKRRRKVKRRSLSVNEMVVVRENPRVATNKYSGASLIELSTKTDLNSQSSENVNSSSNNKPEKVLLPRRRSDFNKRKRSMSVQNISSFTPLHVPKSRAFIEDLENVEIDPSLMIYFRFPPDVQELVGKYLTMQKNSFTLSRVQRQAKEAWADEKAHSENASSKNSTPRKVMSNSQLTSKPSFGSILNARSLVKRWVIRAGKDKQKLPTINDIDAGIALDLKTRCTPVFAQALKSLGYDARGEKINGDMKTLKDFTTVSRIIMNFGETEKQEKREK